MIGSHCEGDALRNGSLIVGQGDRSRDSGNRRKCSNANQRIVFGLVEAAAVTTIQRFCNNSVHANSQRDNHSLVEVHSERQEGSVESALRREKNEDVAVRGSSFGTMRDRLAFLRSRVIARHIPGQSPVGPDSIGLISG